MKITSINRYKNILLSILTLIYWQSSLISASAANSFSYTVPTSSHAGRFEGEIPLNRIGKILLPRGIASFSGDELLIRAVPQWMFDRSIVLRGVIIRAEGAAQAQAQQQFVLGGLLLMLDGLWLSDLSKTAAATESVDTIDGASLEGRILARSGDDALNFQTAEGKTITIPFNQIKTIKSARAFTFNLSADSVKISPTDSSLSFEAKQLILQPLQGPRHALFAYKHVPKSNLAGTEAGISNKALATFIGLDIISTIAPAIAIPLVLNAKNQRAAKNKIAETEFQNFTSSLQSSGSTNAAGSVGSTAAASTGM